MSTRLYYFDSELRVFEATVVACAQAGDRLEVVLDQTAFYPTSGGQPFDTGRLEGVDVIDVLDRDGEVVHVVAGALEAGQRVAGEIDWERRFDHMQQHTGQHVLSAAFDRLVGAHTSSFHLGSDVCTIDLDREVAPAQIATAESEANRIVWEDRHVHVRIVDEEEAGLLPLRKEPVRSGDLRIVEVTGFDFSACGGTHVPRTGMVGVIAIAGWERFKGGTRISFVCGNRALNAHRHLRDVVTTAGRMLSATPDELNAHIERAQAQTRDLQRHVQDLEAQLARFRAAELREHVETIGRFRGVLRADPSGEAATLRTMAQLVVAEPGLVTALVGVGTPAPVVIARSPDVELDASALVKAATAAFGGRGGGRPELAQGGITAPAHEVVTFLRQQLQS